MRSLFIVFLEFIDGYTSYAVCSGAVVQVTKNDLWAAIAFPVQQGNQFIHFVRVMTLNTPVHSSVWHRTPRNCEVRACHLCTFNLSIKDTALG